MRNFFFSLQIKDMFNCKNLETSCDSNFKTRVLFHQRFCWWNLLKVNMQIALPIKINPQRAFKILKFSYILENKVAKVLEQVPVHIYNSHLQVRFGLIDIKVFNPSPNTKRIPWIHSNSCPNWLKMSIK